MSTSDETVPQVMPPPDDASEVSASSSPGLRAARKWVHLVFSVVLMVIGGYGGTQLADGYIDYMQRLTSVALEDQLQSFSIYGLMIIGMGIGFLLSSITFRKLLELLDSVERLSLDDKIAGMVGIILGLAVAYLMSPVVAMLPRFGQPLVAVLYVVGVFGGMLFAFSMKKELVGIFRSSADRDGEKPKGLAKAMPKLLDTNIIIDGRILDVWNTGFLEGELLLPQFVLEELQRLADKADELIRARGRRGLDLLRRMTTEIDTFRVLAAKEYSGVLDDVDTVDSKLLRLAEHMDAAVLTNDSNLNRVADVQGVPVLNVNRLVLALKPAFVAGEELKVNIIRHGREPGQGVAYLDDGTMVVVEDGESKVGRVVDVVVTSLLQTVAGKMIFAELRDGAPHRPNQRGNGR